MNYRGRSLHKTHTHTHKNKHTLTSKHQVGQQEGPEDRPGWMCRLWLCSGCTPIAPAPTAPTAPMIPQSGLGWEVFPRCKNISRLQRLGSKAPLGVWWVYIFMNSRWKNSFKVKRRQKKAPNSHKTKVIKVHSWTRNLVEPSEN